MTSQPRATVLTIGYGDKTLPEFLEALDPHGIELVVDSRAIAESSVEGFSQEELVDALGSHGIDYAHIGELGDFQPVAYPDYMETEDWEEAYGRLISFAQEQQVCLMAPNPDVSTCYRRFIQTRLKEDGFRVVHLTPAGPREAVNLEDQATR